MGGWHGGAYKEPVWPVSGSCVVALRKSCHVDILEGKCVFLSLMAEFTSPLPFPSPSTLSLSSFIQNVYKWASQRLVSSVLLGRRFLGRAASPFVSAAVTSGGHGGGDTCLGRRRGDGRKMRLSSFILGFGLIVVPIFIFDFS